LAILGTSCNGLCDRWHIAAVTEKNPTKICWLWHIGQSPLAYRAVKSADHNVPTVGPTSVISATVGELDAKSTGSGEPVFTLLDVHLYGL
jgi:hypothetical protein